MVSGNVQRSLITKTILGVFNMVSGNVQGSLITNTIIGVFTWLVVMYK